MYWIWMYLDSLMICRCFFWIFKTSTTHAGSIQYFDRKDTTGKKKKRNRKPFTNHKLINLLRQLLLLKEPWKGSWYLQNSFSKKCCGGKWSCNNKSSNTNTSNQNSNLWSSIYGIGSFSYRIVVIRCPEEVYNTSKAKVIGKGLSKQFYRWSNYSRCKKYFQFLAQVFGILLFRSFLK